MADRPMTAIQSDHANASTLESNHESSDIEKFGAGIVKTPATDSPRSIHGWKWGLAVSAILSSVFFFSLDQTIVADIIPDIVHHFGAVQKLPWVSVTLLLAAAGTVNFWAKMYGQFDPKWLYIYCVLGFEVGSAVCGAAPSMNALIVGRAVAGLSGAGMYLGVVMLLSICTTETERPNYFAMVGGTFGLGTVLGPIVGGAFADSSATWRWAFYINLCIGAVFAPIYFLYLPSRDPRPGASFLSRCREIDYLGTLLQVGAFVSGIMAISFGGVLYAWNSATTIALFVLSGVLFILLGLQQTFTVLTTLARRVFPVQYVMHKEMAILFAQIAAASTNSFIAIYFIPLYFQFVQSDQALRSGVRLLPYIIPLVFGSLINGAFMEKFKYYLPWFLTGGLLIVASDTMLFFISLTSSTAYIYAALVLGGLGTGLFVSAPFAIAQWLVPPEEIALAVGFITCAQVAGITISLGVANAVFLNLAENAITDLLPGVARADVQSAVTGAGGAFLRTLDPGMQQSVLQAIVNAIQRVFILGIVAGALAVVLSLGMSRAAISIGGPQAVAEEFEEADREEKDRETGGSNK